mmetsp:Transcript_45811/g.73341  ORF Transcript_45811/g.73341 Transcript_45811/m.73341 type:complete len:117 (+) Transcript_45811:788-1138(+)|eukprot:CAMPEP_0197025424 /NCGR_PEP_ID=MMETSP1384-20130603/5772_1 /TAXON_ID=29189 /ORGANISM="Ammonia sp." /LENGTH=116 /DNA_ID=CAMNT_0042453953 /DNA_START=718 /DNA_END=1068 /DNA_ORIENTATION=+
MAAAKKDIFCDYFNMGQGKCQCPGYVENPSKWSKGKCKRCTHAKDLHHDAQGADEKPKEKNANDANYNDEQQKQGGGDQGGDYNDNNEADQEQGGYQEQGGDEQQQDEDGGAEEEQ